MGLLKYTPSSLQGDIGHETQSCSQSQYSTIIEKQNNTSLINLTLQACVSLTSACCINMHPFIFTNLLQFLIWSNDREAQW